ncbi:uncharacterized protein EKO05_0003545 [Ascochyta rabiei]|uniref:uncharacterized protein n=1 Tax=Didymella rabiei TaxID=5454 RepID=UPI0021FE4410|nr:uncharacterized protein EKO05_0003545 [Ascochyta rabiei]UPX13016.1 hypothetical protein EKO05_0003545 [Ascochyta rabiei]
MFIDTAVANSRSRQPLVIVSPRYAAPYSELHSPLLDDLNNSNDAPPTYLEATTPGLYYGRPSGDEGATLLHRDEQEYKEYLYSGRTFMQSIRTRWASVILLPESSAQAVANEPTVEPTSIQVAQSSPSEGMIAPDIIATPWPSQSVAAPTPSTHTESKQIFPIRWPARCGKKYNVKTDEYDFGSPSAVKVKEAMHQLDGPYKRIQGWIHITKAPASQAAGTVQARMSYAVSPSVNVDSIKYVLAPDGLTIGNPSRAPGFEGVPAGSACLGMSIVLYMAPGATLETLAIEATHLGMQIHSGVEFSVTNMTTISLTSGTLDAASLDSREIRLRTTSGSVSGKYSLSNLLIVDTKTGSVNVDVKPKATAPGESGLAIFKANSHSGSMRIDFERKHIPERDYQILLNTTVGSVDGMFIHGSKTEIYSVAGSVTADILPFKSGAYSSMLQTSTHSGQMNVTLRTPYKAKGVPMMGLTSVHKSISGGMGLRYPKEWQGKIDGTSLSGELHLQGNELQLMSENDLPGKNHVEAQKGGGGSEMIFDTVSGGCDVKVGKS